MMVVGAADGSVSVLRKARRTVTVSPPADLRQFLAHSVSVGGVAVVGPRHFLSWGARQQFALLWKICAS